ncbi:hypothetical protein G5714_002292 [Onychostoma macrolepis]|uniref:Uncharacterized protein n=1 Tax=Onychostoma macrolepis TaxID=369639 RepID=A0A7J6DES7_9TELE|nr:hypothetical protein G5714_002292 [Onychostoma macrolepis]
MSLCCMCGGPVDFPDAHKDCVLCLGHAHAEAALEGSDCQACEELPIKILRARLAVVRSSSPPAPASPPPAAFEPRAGRLQVIPSGGSNEGLTSAQRPRRPRTPEPPLIYVEESSRPPTKARELVSFGCEEDDTMSTNASDPDAWSERSAGYAGRAPPPNVSLRREPEPPLRQRQFKKSRFGAKPAPRQQVRPVEKKEQRS